MALLCVRCERSDRNDTVVNTNRQIGGNNRIIQCLHFVIECSPVVIEFYAAYCEQSRWMGIRVFVFSRFSALPRAFPLCFVVIPRINTTIALLASDVRDDLMWRTRRRIRRTDGRGCINVRKGLRCRVLEIIGQFSPVLGLLLLLLDFVVLWKVQFSILIPFCFHFSLTQQQCCLVGIDILLMEGNNFIWNGRIGLIGKFWINRLKWKLSRFTRLFV